MTAQELGHDRFFYRKLISNSTSIMLYLFELMGLYPQSSFKITEKETESFKELIQKLSDITSLAYSQTLATEYQLVNDSF